MKFKCEKELLEKTFSLAKNNKIIFHLFEVYSHAKALDFHRNTNYYKDYRLKIVDLLEKPIEVKILNSLNSI